MVKSCKPNSSALKCGGLWVMSKHGTFLQVDIQRLRVFYLFFYTLTTYHCCIYRLYSWRHQACWHWNIFKSRACRGVCEQPVGHCVWWLLEYFWCKSCLQTAWLLRHRWAEENIIVIIIKITAIIVVFRCNCLQSCFLWPRNCPHPPGWCQMY